MNAQPLRYFSSILIELCSISRHCMNKCAISIKRFIAAKEQSAFVRVCINPRQEGAN